LHRVQSKCVALHCIDSFDAASQQNLIARALIALQFAQTL